MEIEAPGEVDPNNFAVQLCDQIDGLFCYTILLGISVYALYLYIREIFTIKKQHTLRTFILFFTFIGCMLLLIYTFLVRFFDGWWSDTWESVGDLVTSSIAFIQYFLVVLWFLRSSWHYDEHKRHYEQIGRFAPRRSVAIGLPSAAEAALLAIEDGDFSCSDAESSSVCHNNNDCDACSDHIDEDSDAATPFRLKPSISVFVMSLLIPYNVVGLVLIFGKCDLGVFRYFQNSVMFIATGLFLLCGVYSMIYVQRNTNVLDITPEFYSVLQRSKIIIYVLTVCAMFSLVLSGLSIFARSSISAWTDVMETRYYSCHRLPCLINFFMRIIFLVAIPNCAVSFMFSSPREQDLFLLPVDNTRSSAFFATIDSSPSSSPRNSINNNSSRIKYSKLNY